LLYLHDWYLQQQQQQQQNNVEAESFLKMTDRKRKNIGEGSRMKE
jgi:hypothetical protein